MSLSRKEIQKRKQRQESVRKKLAEQRDEIRKERKLVEVERNIKAGYLLFRKQKCTFQFAINNLSSYAYCVMGP
jgi:hypothetical protein